MSAHPEIVATIVAGTNSKLSQDQVKDVAALAEKSGGASVRTDWLAPDKAVDVFCSDVEADNLRSALNKHFENEPVDILVQLASTRRKKLLLADMESTIIEQEMLDELAADLGFGDETAAITRRAMNNELDFVTALRERVSLLKGQPTSILDVAAKRITFMPGAVKLLAIMKEQKAVCWLVTGGFAYFAEPVVRNLGFDKLFANNLIVHDGLLTGEVAEPILDRNSKKVLLEKACMELAFTLSQAVAVGDGANDIPMLTGCNDGGGLGVAYRAKPAVRAVVPHQINHGDLSALLYAQGYKA